MKLPKQTRREYKSARRSLFFCMKRTFMINKTLNVLRYIFIVFCFLALVGIGYAINDLQKYKAIDSVTRSYK